MKLIKVIQCFRSRGIEGLPQGSQTPGHASEHAHQISQVQVQGPGKCSTISRIGTFCND